MPDRYQQLVNNPLGRLVTRQVGLPNPTRLERFTPGQPVVSGAVLLGAATGSRLAAGLTATLASAQAEVVTAMDDAVRSAAASAGLEAGIWNPDAPDDRRFKALVFDATGISGSEQLTELWAFLSPTIRRLRSCGRVIVLGTPPEDASTPPHAVAQRALEGLVRAVGKEVRSGTTAQLVYVRPGGEHAVQSTLRFLLSPRSAFVSGQVVRVGPPGAELPALDWERPLAGKVALVTGAARGIGASIADVLARDGAHVVGLDVPAMTDELTEKMTQLGGSTLAVDITESRAPAEIAGQLLELHGGVDVVVHNAGVTRDKTLGRMTEELWNTVIEINLTAPQRIDRELFARERRAQRRQHRLCLLDQRHRRQCRPDQLLDVEGRRDRNRRGIRAGAARARRHDQRGRAGLHRDPDDRGDADCDPRGRPADEQPLPGRPSRRCRRDRRVDGEPGLSRRHRQRGPRLRPEPDRSVSIVADRELARSPRMSLLFARAGASALPGASLLPFLGGRGRALPSGAALTLDSVRVDRDRLAAYDRVCGFALRDTLPATYPHMLAFPLHLALITDSSFPFPAVGLLHISNRIVVHRPIDAGEALALRVWCEPGEPHPRGTAVRDPHAGAGRRGAGLGGAVGQPASGRQARPTRGADRGPVERGSARVRDLAVAR